MKSHYEQNGLTWIDLSAPTRAEIREVLEEYNIAPDLGDLLLASNRNPLVQREEDTVLFTLHFPTPGHNNDRHAREINFLAREDLLVTAHIEPIDTITNFTKDFEVETVLEEDSYQHGGTLASRIVQKLYHRLAEELEGLEDRLENVKARVFEGGERQMVKVLSDINRDLLEYKQVIHPHGSALEHLAHITDEIFSEQAQTATRASIQAHQELSRAITANKETLSEIRHTNDSLLSARATQVMKTLTIITFATYPSLFIAELFSVEAQSTPIIGTSNDFWIIVLIIALATIATFGYFVYKRWF